MNKPAEKPRKVLGKGLSALLPPRPAPASPATPVAAGQPPALATPPIGRAVLTLKISAIDPNPLQPRTVFDPARIEELAASIKANGIIQPLIVRRTGERHQLVAGERRLRAATLAGLTEVPAVVQDYADDRLLEIALIENIQREDLNPIEIAQALDRLARDLHLSHDEIGRRTGKDRTTVTNLLRLLRLPESIQVLVAENRLTMGHARALLALPTAEMQLQLAQRAQTHQFSVRQVEREVQALTQKPQQPPELSPPVIPTQDPNVTAAIRHLEAALGTRIRIVAKSEQRGRIEIEYYSQDDLSRIYDLMMGASATPPG